MSIHVKKCHPAPFRAVVGGLKPFEWRREDDCRYEVGDLLILLEWDPDASAVLHPKYDKTEPGYERRREPNGYTGNLCKRSVTYVLRGEFEVPRGFVILGLRDPKRP
jgi:hypothetical protein